MSERELEVLAKIAEGYSNKEIAAQMGVSLKSVVTYKALGMKKLKMRLRVDLVRYAVRQGWMTDA